MIWDEPPTTVLVAVREPALAPATQPPPLPVAYLESYRRGRHRRRGRGIRRRAARAAIWLMRPVHWLYLALEAFAWG